MSQRNHPHITVRSILLMIILNSCAPAAVLTCASYPPELSGYKFMSILHQAARSLAEQKSTVTVDENNIRHSEFRKITPWLVLVLVALTTVILIRRYTTISIKLKNSIRKRSRSKISINLDDRKFLFNDHAYRQTALVVDDQPESCRYLNLLMEDYHLITCCNSIEGFELVEKHLPDLVISNLSAAGYKEAGLPEKIKTDPRYRHIPVIVLQPEETGKDHLLVSRIQKLVLQRRILRQLSCAAMVPGETDRTFMVKVHAVIKKHYRDSDFTVNQIIEEMAMSRSVFYKKLKNCTTGSINDLIREYRLKKARELLLNSNLSVSEVAYASGFNNPAYFSTVFKEYYHASPVTFREEQMVN